MGTVPTERAAECARGDVSRLGEAAALARVCLRILLLSGWTLGCFGARIAALPVAFVNGDAERRMRGVVLRTWGRGVCWIVGAQVNVFGPLPREPFFLVSNHLSFFDVIVYARLLGCVFVSMAEVGAWPLVGTLARGLNTVFIDRARRRDVARVNAQISGVVSRGNGVLIFPESTTSYGDTVLPFYGALLQPAVAMQMPVHYAAISYATPTGEDSAEHAICWVDDTPFAVQAFRILRLRRFEVFVTFGDEPVVAENRKVLADALHTAVAELRGTTP
ncbi:MAG: 1-acyl-sn-glycerol-3-phosphate acyltransferase [Candidatus Hydrogenedentes bacterium]|nr:1-acyl-sn-glycerol-3-phosphate acyltransferase [Candidatus Hydrogenedentota bacterium]